MVSHVWPPAANPHMEPRCTPQGASLTSSSCCVYSAKLLGTEATVISTVVLRPKSARADRVATHRFPSGNVCLMKFVCRSTICRSRWRRREHEDGDEAVDEAQEETMVFDSQLLHPDPRISHHDSRLSHLDSRRWLPDSRISHLNGRISQPRFFQCEYRIA